MDMIEQDRIGQLNLNVGIELLKISKNKKSACIFCHIKEHNNYNDLFSVLCYKHQFMELRDINVDFYDDRNTDLKEIYNQYDFIIHITGKRFQKKTDIHFFVKNEKEVIVEYSVCETFTWEMEFVLSESFDCRMYNYIDDAPHKWHKEIKPEYKHLL